MPIGAKPPIKKDLPQGEPKPKVSRADALDETREQKYQEALKRVGGDKESMAVEGAFATNKDGKLQRYTNGAWVDFSGTYEGKTYYNGDDVTEQTVGKATEDALALLKHYEPSFKLTNKMDLVFELERLRAAKLGFLTKEELGILDARIKALKESGYKGNKPSTLESIKEFLSGSPEDLALEITRLQDLKKKGIWSDEQEAKLTELLERQDGLEKEIQIKNDEEDAAAEEAAATENGKTKKPDIATPELWTHKGLQYEVTEYDEYNRPSRGYQVVNGQKTKTEKRFELGPVKFYVDPKTGKEDNRYVVMATRNDGKPTLLYDTVDKVEIVKDYPNDPDKDDLELAVDAEKKAITKAAMEKIKANERLKEQYTDDEEEFDKKWQELEDDIDNIQDQINTNQERFEETYSQYANAEVNENEYWEDKGFFQVVGLGIGLMLGSIGAAGLGKSKSTALTIVENAIDRNIKAQEFNIKKGNNMMAKLNARLGHLGLSKFRMETIGKSILLQRQKLSIEKQKIDAPPEVQAHLDVVLAGIDKKLIENKRTTMAAVTERGIKSATAARKEEVVQRTRYNKLIEKKLGADPIKSYTEIQSFLSADKALSHHSISYALVKLIDPESKGVTDVDVKTMKKGLGGSMYNRFKSSINKFITGKDLTAKTMEDIQIVMKILLWNKLKEQRNINRKFREDVKVINKDNPLWHGKVKVKTDLIIDSVDYKKFFSSAQDVPILRYLEENPTKSWDEVFKKFKFGFRKGFKIDNKVEK